MPDDRRSLDEIRAQRDRDQQAAVALRRSGKSAGETAEILGLSSARRVRELTQSVDLDAPAPTPAAAKAVSAARTKRLPRKKKGEQPATGRVLAPILLYDGPGGGFGIPRESVSAAGLGPNIPVGESDQFGRVKIAERVVDMGTTLEHDARRYDSARNDESWDDLEVPPGATTAVLVHADGSETVVDL